MEMEAEEKARRAQRQDVYREEKRRRAYYLSIALKRGAASNLGRPMELLGRR